MAFPRCTNVEGRSVACGCITAIPLVRRANAFGIWHVKRITLYIQIRRRFKSTLVSKVTVSASKIEGVSFEKGSSAAPLAPQFYDDDDDDDN